jgi:hypothetical protein
LTVNGEGLNEKSLTVTVEAGSLAVSPPDFAVVPGAELAVVDGVEAVDVDDAPPAAVVVGSGLEQPAPRRMRQPTAPAT